MEASRLEQTDPQSLKTMRRGWCLGDEESRQELLERAEGKLGDHHSGALRARLRQETTLSVKTIAGRIHLGTSKSANARLYRWMHQSVPVASAPPTRLFDGRSAQSD
jgi:hypothetical protein